MPALVDAVIDSHTRNPRLHKVLFDEAPRTPELPDRLRRAESTIAEAVADRLPRRRARSATDADTAAQIVVATIESLTHHFVSRNPDTFDPLLLRGHILRLLHPYLHETD